jgi:hypothetical protein
MATLDEVYRAVLPFCPKAVVDEQSDGTIVIVLMKTLGDDRSTLVDYPDDNDDDAE